MRALSGNVPRKGDSTSSQAAPGSGINRARSSPSGSGTLPVRGMRYAFCSAGPDRSNQRETCRSLDVRHRTAAATFADVRHMPHTRRPHLEGDGIMKPVAKTTETRSWVAPHAKIRADSYVMLASLLGQPPSGNLLSVLQNLQWDGPISERLDRALNALRQAGRKYSLS